MAVANANAAVSPATSGRSNPGSPESIASNASSFTLAISLQPKFGTSAAASTGRTTEK